MKIFVVYEISKNPYFTLSQEGFDDRLSEFVQPSEINNLIKALQQNGHQVEVVDGPSELLLRHDDIKQNRGIVFNKSIGYKGLERKIQVPAICQLFSIPCIGTSAYGMTLARHKYHTNLVIMGAGIRTAVSRIVFPGANISLEGLAFPLIVKPNHESDSLGIDENSVHYGPANLEAAINFLHEQFQQPVIIEEFIPGEEWKIPVIGNYPASCAIGGVGVLKNGKTMEGTLQTRKDVIDDMFDYYNLRENQLKDQAMRIAARVHDLLELRDYSRCDFRLDANGELVCMEVATHPDISSNSSFIAAALQIYESYEAIIEKIVNTALARFQF